MASTRFHDDKCRIEKQLEESTYAGRYFLNTPGNGLNPGFISDPNIRLQKWGGVLMKNPVDLESSLIGVNKREIIRSKKNYNNIDWKTQPTRLTHPAWEYRHLPMKKICKSDLHYNPQQHAINPITKNINSRLEAEDKYNSKYIYG